MELPRLKCFLFCDFRSADVHSRLRAQILRKNYSRTVTVCEKKDKTEKLEMPKQIETKRQISNVLVDQLCATSTVKVKIFQHTVTQSTVPLRPLYEWQDRISFSQECSNPLAILKQRIQTAIRFLRRHGGTFKSSQCEISTRCFPANIFTIAETERVTKNKDPTKLNIRRKYSQQSNFFFKPT